MSVKDLYKLKSSSLEDFIKNKSDNFPIYLNSIDDIDSNLILKYLKTIGLEVSSVIETTNHALREQYVIKKEVVSSLTHSVYTFNCQFIDSDYTVYLATSIEGEQLCFWVSQDIIQNSLSDLLVL